MKSLKNKLSPILKIKKRARVKMKNRKFMIPKKQSKPHFSSTNICILAKKKIVLVIKKWVKMIWKELNGKKKVKRKATI